MGCLFFWPAKEFLLFDVMYDILLKEYRLGYGAQMIKFAFSWISLCCEVQMAFSYSLVFGLEVLLMCRRAKVSSRS